MKEILEAFADKTETPTEDEINTLADQWESYILKDNPMRGVFCRKDFLTFDSFTYSCCSKYQKIINSPRC